MEPMNYLEELIERYPVLAGVKLRSGKLTRSWNHVMKTAVSC